MNRIGRKTVTLVAALALAGCGTGEPEVEQVEEVPADVTDAPGGEDADDSEDVDDVTEDDGAEGNPAGEVIEVDGGAFVSPSTNIACFLTPDAERGAHVACDIGESDFASDVLDPDSVPPAWEEGHCPDPGERPWTVVLAEGSAFWDCTHEPIAIAADVEYAGSWVGDGPTEDMWDGLTVAVLGYGQTLRTQTHECLSESDGITCQEVDGASGFTLSRAGLAVW